METLRAEQGRVAVPWFPRCVGGGGGRGGVSSGSYPARSFSFLSVMPSLDTSLLNTRMPMAMFTCGQRRWVPTLCPRCAHPLLPVRGRGSWGEAKAAPSPRRLLGR